jgi:nucleoid-associated protein YgaU
MISQTTLVSTGAACAAVAAVGATIYWAHPGFLWPSAPPVVLTEPAQPNPAPPPPDSIAAATPSSSAPTTVKPAFDVVSVEPTGEAVVAGRAAPNVKVALLDGDRTLAEATTDAEGQFVIIPTPLPPGDHSLTLSTGAGGPAETSNAIPVSVKSPPVQTAAAPPSTQGAPSSPPAVPSAPSTQGAPAEVAIHSVEASADGGMVAKGSAEPNATVRLYVSGVYVGDARTGDNGRWSLTILNGLTPGAYAVRADKIDPASAGVVARAEAPFNFPAALAPEKPGAAASAPTLPPASSPADVVVDVVHSRHVERGDTLWGISQRFFGDGTRYRVIYSANSNQIRDPNLIYPGQTFVVPKGDPQP